MDSISIIDNSFDVNITTSYFLSIQLSLDGFSFCVLDPISNEYIQFWYKPINIHQNIEEVLQYELEHNDVLIYPYQKVFFSYTSHPHTLIPDSLFNKDEAATYLDFCFSKPNTLKQEQLAFYNKVKMADSWCVFQIPLKITQLLDKYYPEIKYLCQTIPFIENALLHASTDTNSNQVHIYVSKGNFEIAVKKGNSLLLHNTFDYQNTKDFLYFTLFVIDQLKLDSHHTKIFLAGNIDKKMDLYITLKKYIKKVEITESTKHFKFASSFKNIQIHNHLNLFNIPLCV